MIGMNAVEASGWIAGWLRPFLGCQRYVSEASDRCHAWVSDYKQVLGQLE